MARPFQLFRFSRWLLHRLGMQGHLPLALVDDVQPVLPLWSELDLENLYLREEHRWGAHVDQAAVVGQFSYIALQNPPQSGLLAVVENARVVGAAAILRYGCVHTPLLPSVPRVQTALDSRRADPGSAPAGAVQNVVLVGGSNAVNPLPTDAPRIAQTASAPWQELSGRGFVVAPGSYFAVVTDVVNQAVGCSCIWRTVPMLPPESDLNTG